jgi:hypothetical protein
VPGDVALDDLKDLALPRHRASALCDPFFSTLNDQEPAAYAPIKTDI